MKKLVLILVTAFALIGCGSNPIANTQWEIIPGTLNDIQLISFDKDTCTWYGTSSINGESSIIGLKYHVDGNTITFSPLNVKMDVYPTLIIDGNFLIFEKTNKPTFRKITP